MPRGGARPGAGRKALDQPKEPLLTYSLVLRPTDAGYLNKLGHGNLSLGLRRLIDEARTHSAPPPITHPTPIRASWKVTAAPAIHVQPWLDSLAYRLDSPEGGVVFTGDTQPCRSVIDLARGADVLLCMCWDDQEIMNENGENVG